MKTEQISIIDAILDWTEDNFGAVLTMVVLAATILAFYGVNAYSGFQCRQKGGFMGYQSWYTPTTGCMVKVDGAWWPVEAVRKEVR